MSEKYVVGATTTREVFVASKTDDLKLDEYVVIEDMIQGDLVAEVISIQAYPQVKPNTFASETCLYDSLEELDMIGRVYIAKVKTTDELVCPITPGSAVRKSSFNELESQLLPKQAERGMAMGVYRGTEHVQSELPAHLSTIAPMFEQGVVTEQKGLPLLFDFYQMQEYPHIGLFGNSGSGKTFGMRVIAEELMDKGIPAILLDPHYEFDFSRGVDGYGYSFAKRYETFEIGREVGIDFTDITTDELITLIQFDSELSPQMQNALEELHERNDSIGTLEARIEKLTAIFEHYENQKRKPDDDLGKEEKMLYERYKNKISGATTLKAVAWRFNQLKKTGIFVAGIGSIEKALLGRKFAVVRGKGKLLSMFSSYLIRKCYGKRRAYRDYEQKGGRKQGHVPDKFPPFFVMMDEAHRFAPKDGRTPFKSLLKEIAQEARKYGVYLVLGTQSPSFLDKVIASQMSTKVIFRISEQADMEMMKTETNLSELQSSRLPDLKAGNAFISSPILGKTMSMRFRCTKTLSPHRAHPFDELENFASDEALEEVLLEFLPIKHEDLPKHHAKITKAYGKYVDVPQIVDTLDAMAVAGKIDKENGLFGVRYFPLEA